MEEKWEISSLIVAGMVRKKARGAWAPPRFEIFLGLAVQGAIFFILGTKPIFGLPDEPWAVVMFSVS